MILSKKMSRFLHSTTSTALGSTLVSKAIGCGRLSAGLRLRTRNDAFVAAVVGGAGVRSSGTNGGMSIRAVSFTCSNKNKSVGIGNVRSASAATASARTNATNRLPTAATIGINTAASAALPPKLSAVRRPPELNRHHSRTTTSMTQSRNGKGVWLPGGNGGGGVPSFVAALPSCSRGRALSSTTEGGRLGDRTATPSSNKGTYDDGTTTVMSPEDLAMAVDAAIENVDCDGGIHSAASPSSVDIEESTNNNNEDDRLSQIPGTGDKSSGRKLAIVYTCGVCETRSARKFTENAYRNGVVLVRCPGCQNLHLIADRLGWFDEEGKDGGWDVEKLVAEKGGEGGVTTLTEDNVIELTRNSTIPPPSDPGSGDSDKRSNGGGKS